MSVGVDLSVRTLYNQICAYAQFLQARRAEWIILPVGIQINLHFSKQPNVTTFWIHALVTARTSIKSLRPSVESRLLQLDLGRISNSNVPEVINWWEALRESIKAALHTS